MNHSLTCLMGVITDDKSGKVIALRVCGHCEKERGETGFLHAYAERVLKIDSFSHGICPPHYQAEQARIQGDKSDLLDEILETPLTHGPTGGPNHQWERRCVVINA